MIPGKCWILDMESENPDSKVNCEKMRYREIDERSRSWKQVSIAPTAGRTPGSTAYISLGFQVYVGSTGPKTTRTRGNLSTTERSKLKNSRQSGKTPPF